ncbi:MAG: L-2-hydroxyglutarate oxidase [Desulfobacteraceae bacterium]|nr:L-2-hydroxyglutarate oxidase [Desulfobacteraceae bacterium]
MIHHADMLIVGAGIVGLTAAREFIANGWKNIIIIDKESSVGVHASGRNSGVLHAGIYYAPDSLKAKSCLNGNFLMREYCRNSKLPVLETGKVIVARNKTELPVLDELYRRAMANSAKVEMIDEHRLSQIEPNAKTCEKALFSHYTAVVNPKLILSCLKQELENSSKVKFMFDCRFQDVIDSTTVRTSCGDIRFEYLINAAGAYCDKVAAAFGAGLAYRMVPFKGIYRKLKKSRSDMISGNIYPVPDIRNPFLGVHFTKNIYGDVYLGPTAIPAFGRENYGIIKGMDSEALPILLTDAELFFSNPKFRTVALSEPAKYFLPVFFKDAASLVKKLDISDIEPSDKAGIRAQLVHRKTGELVYDFTLEKAGNTLHVLNPVSPAFTSSMDLAKQIVSSFL